jgi:hypothetical protein
MAPIEPYYAHMKADEIVSESQESLTSLLLGLFFCFLAALHSQSS